MNRRFEFVKRIIKETRKIVNEDGSICEIKLPKRSTAKSAGYDFYNPETVIIEPGEIKYVKTGIKALFPEDEMLMLCNRSSNPKKKGLILINRNWNCG